MHLLSNRKHLWPMPCFVDRSIYRRGRINAGARDARAGPRRRFWGLPLARRNVCCRCSTRNRPILTHTDTENTNRWLPIKGHTCPTRSSRNRLTPRPPGAIVLPPPVPCSGMVQKFARRRNRFRQRMSRSGVYSTPCVRSRFIISTMRLMDLFGDQATDEKNICSHMVIGCLQPLSGDMLHGAVVPTSSNRNPLIRTEKRIKVLLPVQPIDPKAP